MDSRAWIDCAVFHLTPTRTRCDLVIFVNGLSEKIASGLLEPFLLHLNCAKQQIEKGGYSITLAPPAPAAWFTKGTLQRFVRFVSSPEVLERFVTIEKEIEQINESIRANELACEEADAHEKEALADKTLKWTASASELNDKIKETNNAAQEEHSKVRLQQVLETRKAVLHKEQAMAYARALVTGFQMDHLDALLAFADSFGASRLRGACYNFIELCKKKNQDRLWIAEVAAMQASSHSQLSYSGTFGIVLAEDENGSGQLPTDASQESDQTERNRKPQPPSMWTNNYPQYFPNYYGPIHPQNMPPYQEYPFPGMHVGNPYYPANMFTDSGRDGKNRNSAGKKGRSSRERRADTWDKNVNSGSSSESALEESEGGEKNSSKKNMQKKEKGKRPSKKVVIRNINYINSKKDGSDSEESSSDDEELFNGDSIKQKIEEAVGSFNRHRRQKKQLEAKQGSAENGSNGFSLGNSNAKNSQVEQMSDTWGAFQNILLRDQVTNTSTVNQAQVGEKIFVTNNSEGRGVVKQRVDASYSLVVNRDIGGNGDGMHIENFEGGENFRGGVKNSSSTDEMMILSGGNGEHGNFVRTTQSDYVARSTIVKSKSEEDWYIRTESSILDRGTDKNILEGDYTASVDSIVRIEKGNNDIVDDSFILQPRGSQHDMELKTDLSMVLDIAEATHQKNDALDRQHEKRQISGTFEPEDLYLVLDRSSSHEQFVVPRTPEIDYENMVKVSETDKIHSSCEPNAEDHLKAKANVKGAKSNALGGALGKRKSEIVSRNRKPSAANKTIGRKTKQDLEEERRVRMEELLIQRQKRIAERKSDGATRAAIKREFTDSGKSVKGKKPPVHSATQEKKLLRRSSTIDRPATSRISRQATEAQSKTTQFKKASVKLVGEPKKKSVGNVTKKPAPSKEKHLEKKSRGSYPKRDTISDVLEKKDTMDVGFLPQAEVLSSPESTTAGDSQSNGKNLEELETYNSEIPKKKESSVLPEEVTSLPAQTLSVDDAGEVKELQTCFVIEENKEKVISSEMANGLGEATTELSPPKPLDQGAVAKQPSPESSSSDTAFEHPETVAPSTKQAKAPSVTFAATTKISEIQVSTPASSIGLTPDSTHSRKKWDSSNDYSNSNSTKVAKGLKKLLMFGRKSRPISYA